LLPLLAGIGISLAAKYYLGSKETTQRRSFTPRPTRNTIPESSHSTDKSVSVDTTIGSTTSNDMSRSASASGSTGASGTSNPFGSRVRLTLRVHSIRRVQPAVRDAAISAIKPAAVQPIWHFRRAETSNPQAIPI
jgi:hypothetical protein